LESTVEVERILVLWDDDRDRHVLPHLPSLSTQGLSLNESLELGAASAREECPETSIVVVPADLPALHGAELALCLARAAQFGRTYLPDAKTRGTTLLTARTGFPLLPAYGANSSAAHAATNAKQLEVRGVPSARTDVDDLESLGVALALGCGSHTLSTCASSRVAPELTVSWHPVGDSTDGHLASL
jgi:2-phospho-L-lactate guanylyltransferase